MLLAKGLSNGQRGGERHAIFGLNHVLNGGFEDFLSFGGGDFSFRHVRLLPEYFLAVPFFRAVPHPVPSIP